MWGVFGDGEMDEPESIGALTLAARENLDNLTFVINCNLQRLDGPVRGNGQIIQELESLFAGAGWNVIKVLWGSDWDALFARDTHHALLRQLRRHGRRRVPDARRQRRRVQPASTSSRLDPGAAGARRAHDAGRDRRASSAAATTFASSTRRCARRAGAPGQPTVILAKTKKGYGMGGAGESRMTAHQQKKLDVDALREFRDRFGLPLSDEDLAELRFYEPAEDSREMRYLRERRAALGGYLPRAAAQRSRRRRAAARARTRASRPTADGKEMSTTMAAVRLLSNLLQGSARSGRASCRSSPTRRARSAWRTCSGRSASIRPLGQLYEPEDAASMLCYREAKDGQLLEEGITEAGALSSWIAAATAYSVHGIAMLPFYIYYSMFGFQRVGDLIWAAADQRARGFLLGATAGRTTLGGEGLQHQDGSSHVVAATVPNCRAYDPAFAGELAVIVDHGARQMLERQEDVFYYVTVMNENYAQPSLPEGAEADIVRGMYRIGGHEVGAARCDCSARARSCARCIAAAELLRRDWNVGERGVQRHELQRARARCARRRALRTACIRRTPTRRSHVASARRQRADHRRHRLRARVSRSSSPRTSRRRSPPWAPTASVAATRVRRCALLRGRSAPRRDRGAACAGAGGECGARGGCRGPAQVRDRHRRHPALVALSL